MPRFIETIKLLDGEFYNLKYHQKRIEFTFDTFFKAVKNFDLKRELNESAIPMVGLYKCRVVYETEIDEIVFQPYTIKPIRSLKVIESNSVDYNFKFENRQLLNKLYEQKESADDIIIVKNGLVTDSSYANLIFKSGNEWVTPTQPLLAGTMRQKLIDENKIKVKKILVNDIHKYEKVKLINSMLGWSGPEVEISQVLF